MADVANTWPLDPTPSTMIEAMTTIKSVKKKQKRKSGLQSPRVQWNLLPKQSLKLLERLKLLIYRTKTIHGLSCFIWEMKKMPGAPMIDMGFLIKRRRPLMPAYLLRQPADHSRTTYSVPKNSTSTISCGAQCKHKARVTFLHWYRDNNCETHTGREGVEVDKVLFLNALITIHLKRI